MKLRRFRETRRSGTMRPMPTTEFPPTRLLLGPGPSPVDARVLAAVSAPPVSHLDPYFVGMMADLRRRLRLVFDTENELTFPISGTGTAGMEAAFANAVVPESTVVVGVMGFFGERMAEIAARAGARVVRVEAEWGRPVDPSKIIATLDANPGASVLALVHAETSTGVRQPLSELAEYLSTREAITFVLDTVTSLGAHAVEVDNNRIDIAYSCSQKALGALPGLAPITFSERAVEAVRQRSQPVQSWYHDVTTLERYWLAETPVYHHTVPVSLHYALAEALGQIEQEGLEARRRRHKLNARAFEAGLEAMGVSSLPAREHRLNSLHAVRVPDGVDEGRVRRRLLVEFGIEIGAGVGQLAGKIWRVGFMGHGSTRTNVIALLTALQSALRSEGFHAESGVEAADELVRDAAVEASV